MDAEPRCLEAGDAAFVIEGEERIDPAVNAWAVGLASVVRGYGIPGIRDVVPTFRSLTVYFDPARTDINALRAALLRDAKREFGTAEEGREAVRIPVCYGGEWGPDLAEVARFAGLDEGEVIREHVKPHYRVFMVGFMPGFPYLGTVDARIATPRRSTPRVIVPAGSVGIAGSQTGIYPLDVPGGWQLIGRTPVRLFDAEKTPPSLLRPGDSVRFVPIDRDEFERESVGNPANQPPPRLRRSAGALAKAEAGSSRQAGSARQMAPRSSASSRWVTVTRPGLFTTVQDLGRWGWQAEGVPVSGAMDPWSLSAANLLVGNDVNCAALEVTLIGPELAFDDECVVALTGAEFAVTMNGTAVATGRPFVVPKGGRLRFGERRRGARAYVAFGGGIDVASILGSRSTHVRSRMGGVDGRALVPGDRLPLASSRGTTPADLRAARHDIGESRLESSTAHTSHARVRVLAGPQRDRFTSNALDALQSAPYTLTQESDRMGFRLSGPRLEHTRGADIISDATPLGALQVPGEGQPLLLMAERQTTGGYPKLATVISADIGIAGQLAPGDRISFELCSMKDAMSALIARERALMTVRG